MHPHTDKQWSNSLPLVSEGLGASLDLGAQFGVVIENPPFGNLGCQAYVETPCVPFESMLSTSTRRSSLWPLDCGALSCCPWTLTGWIRHSQNYPRILT